MENDERLSGALQENILTLLCFDDLNCKVARGALTPQLFESSVFREVAGHAIDFIDQYGKTIGDHLPDHLESILKGDDARKAATYKRLVDNLFLSRDSINSEYVISSLYKFVRLQNIKSALMRAVECVEDGRVDAAEVELQKGLNTQSVAFEAGLSLNNADDVGSILDNPEEEGFDLGIPELDSRGIIPRRKELFMLMAARGKGKSWFITHCLKQAQLQRWSAVAITLEMGERSYAARLLQSFFSISRRQATVRVTRFAKENGSLSDLVQEEIVRPTMRDDGIKETLISRAKREFARRMPLRIKAFPTKQLTLPQLAAYLDGLERFEKFTPDLICVDYPDLFALDGKNLRTDLGDLVAGLRGLAVQRNAALVTVTQGNRESETATTVTGSMVAEDISKLATADTLLTYSQTPAEIKLGLARLFVEKCRNEEGKVTVLISQAYAVGQFCLDSVGMGSDYWERVGDKAEHEERKAGGERRQGERRRRDDDEPPRRGRRGD